MDGINDSLKLGYAVEDLAEDSTPLPGCRF